MGREKKLLIIGVFSEHITDFITPNHSFLPEKSNQQNLLKNSAANHYYWAHIQRFWEKVTFFPSPHNLHVFHLSEHFDIFPFLLLSCVSLFLPPIQIEEAPIKKERKTKKSKMKGIFETALEERGAVLYLHPLFLTQINQLPNN